MTPLCSNTDFVGHIGNPSKLLTGPIMHCSVGLLWLSLLWCLHTLALKHRTALRPRQWQTLLHFCNSR